MFFERAEMFSKEHGRIHLQPMSAQLDESDNTLLLLHDGPVGTITSQQMWDKDYHIWHSVFYCEKNTQITLRFPDEPSIGLAFLLKGDLKYNREGLVKGISRKNEYNMYFIPQVSVDYTFEQRDYEAFGVQFSRDYLQRWSDLPLLNEFLSKTESSLPVKIADTNQVMSTLQLMLIKEIQRCKYTGTLRKMYLESKVLELLRVSIERLDVDQYPPEHALLKESDIQKIRGVYEHIIKNLDDPGSILDLSRMAGINDHKLKAGFKTLYGTSILAFIIDQRLLIAKTLLVESDLSIKAIAKNIGYSDRSNFTAAFKKKFGYPPKDIKLGK